MKTVKVLVTIALVFVLSFIVGVLIPNNGLDGKEELPIQADDKCGDSTIVLENHTMNLDEVVKKDIVNVVRIDDSHIRLEQDGFLPMNIRIV